MIRNQEYHIRDISSQYNLFVDTCGFLADKYTAERDLNTHRASATSALEYFLGSIDQPGGKNIFTIEEVATELSKLDFMVKYQNGRPVIPTSEEKRYISLRDDLISKLKERSKIVSKAKHPKFSLYSEIYPYEFFKKNFDLSRVDYSLLLSSLAHSHQIPTAGVSNDGMILKAFKFVVRDLHINRDQFNFFSHDSVGVFKLA